MHPIVLLYAASRVSAKVSGEIHRIVKQVIQTTYNLTLKDALKLFARKVIIEIRHIFKTKDIDLNQLKTRHFGLAVCCKISEKIENCDSVLDQSEKTIKL